MGPVALDDEGDELRERFAKLLTAALKRPVRVVAAESYAEVSALLLGGKAQLGWLPPAIFVRLERESGAHLLAAVERSQGAGYRGVSS
jgi:ABC-type phosphate/phosphonate transport system substrate-binding protein